jgi:Tannase and feruloyl esterase
LVLVVGVGVGCWCWCWLLVFCVGVGRDARTMSTSHQTVSRFRVFVAVSFAFLWLVTLSPMLGARPSALPAVEQSSDDAACAHLTSVSIPGVTVTNARSAETPTTPSRTFCRVAAILAPTTDSDIKVELWMPSTNWNRKFQAVGNGGFSGAINYAAMTTALARGYATASTHTGIQVPAAALRWDIPRRQSTSAGEPFTK